MKSAEVYVALDHHCPACGVTTEATVRGRATAGDTQNPFELGHSNNDAFVAETEAQRNAALLIRLARCPACTKRDPVEMRRLAMRFVWALVAVAAIFGVVWRIENDAPVARVLSVAQSMAIGLVVVWASLGLVIWKQLRDSETCVRWKPSTTPAADGPYRGAR